MRNKILAAIAVLAVLAYAAYSGWRDGQEHRTEAGRPTST